MNESTQRLTVKDAIKRFFTRQDRFLFAGAILSLIIIIALTPFTRNQSELNYRVSESEILTKSDTFFRNIGFLVTNYSKNVFVRRDVSLLNALNSEHDPNTVKQASTDSPELAIPLYYFRVVLRPEGSGAIGFNDITNLVTSGEDNVDSELIRSLLYPTVELTFGLDGDLSGFETSIPDESIPAQINRIALEQVLGSSLPDSLNPELIQFEYIARDVANDSIENRVFPVLLSEPHVIDLAKYYLRFTKWSDTPLHHDIDPKVTYNEERRSAEVTFQSRDLFLGNRLQIEVTVDHAGNVLGITPSYVDDENEIISSNFESIATTLGLPVFVIMIFLAMIVLVRRFSRGLIDAKPSKIDALFGAASLMVFLILNSTGGLARGESLGAFDIVSPLMGTIFGTIGGWLLVFFLSVYASSLSQELWPYKLKQLNLIRKGYLINQPVGMTMIRTVFYGICLTGILTVMIAIFPDSGIKWASEYVFFTDQVLFSGVYLVASGVFSVVLIMFFLLLGIAALVHRKFKKSWATIGVIAIFWTLSGFVPADLIETNYTIILLAISGTFIGYILWKHGPIMASLSYLVSLWVWTIAEGLWISQNPDILNLLFLASVPIGLLIFGLYGIKTDITSEELPDYTPAYLLELANRERMVQELKIARQVQLSFLPEKTPEFGGLDLAANCYAANEVGGDYYDFLPVEGNKMGVIIGDVSGKGIQAAFFMTLIKGFTKSLVDGYNEPKAFLSRLNKLFYENSKRGTFISMIYGMYDNNSRTFEFARAGHNPLIVVRGGSKSVEMIESKGLAIGMIADNRFEDVLECKSITLSQDDLIILYTDGYTEAMNYGNRLYGDQRLLDVVKKNAEKSAQEMLDAINHDVRNFIGERPASDDMTMIVMRVR
jgi:hypothetical protein